MRQREILIIFYIVNIVSFAFTHIKEIQTNNFSLDVSMIRLVLIVIFD